MSSCIIELVTTQSLIIRAVFLFCLDYVTYPGMLMSSSGF
jgi:hypothetical protein